MIDLRLQSVGPQNDVNDDGDLDDFDSPDFANVPRADDAYLAGMWGDYSFRSSDDGRARDTVIAHGMVESFVNAFARDGHYAVSFDPTVSTAGTDLSTHQVIITPAPIADPNLSAREAGLILTGLAVHEISHPRYGRGTTAAVQKSFPMNRVADRLSNLLDDIRIERRFVADYPGYAGVFDPTLDYVGKTGTKKGLHVQRLSNPVNIAIAATRYPTFSKWSAATSAEAKWWTDWAERGAKEDAPRRHVEAIREALVHVAEQRAANAKGIGKGGGTAESTQPTEEKTSDATHARDAAATLNTPKPDTMTDDELNSETQYADDQELERAPSCNGSAAVDKAAAEDAPENAIASLKSKAQNIINASRNLEDDGHGRKVDVAKSLKGIVRGGGKNLGPSDLASRYITNAILRSRTGHTAVDPFQRRGRLDQKGLSRIAYGDTRLFERRTAPSPGKYLVWVMVDASVSMAYTIPEAAQVAHAMAAATQGTPSVRMVVYAWSSPFRPTANGASAGVAKTWETGQPTSEIFRMSGLHLGSTPDASVMGWAARAIKRAVRPDETPVIIFISDGQGEAAMDEYVAEARKMGVVVKSVSFGSGFSASAQEVRFGRGNYVPYVGSITATARPMAELFARIISGR